MADYKNLTPEKEAKIKMLENQAGLNSVKTPEELAMQDKENDAIIRKVLNPGRETKIKPNELIKDKHRRGAEDGSSMDERKQEELQRKREEARQIQNGGQKRPMGGRNGRNAAPPPRDIEEIGSLADCLSDDERVLFIQHHLREGIEKKHHDEDDALGRYNGYFYSSWGELVLNDDLQGDLDKK